MTCSISRSSRRGRCRSTIRPTDVAEVVTTTAEGFLPAAAKSGLAIVLQVPGRDGMPVSAPLRPVAADPDRLAQLLANLLENSMTFARTTVTVTLAEDHASGQSVITVDDDGPGIAPDDLQRVFERFYRADRGPNRQMGSGLGLAIVAELASGHGRHGACRVAARRRRRVPLRGDAAPVAGRGAPPVNGLTARLLQ